MRHPVTRELEGQCDHVHCDLPTFGRFLFTDYEFCLDHYCDALGVMSELLANDPPPQFVAPLVKLGKAVKAAQITVWGDEWKEAFNDADNS